MIKYGELSTKKANINLFLKQLKDNVSFMLKDVASANFLSKFTSWNIKQNKIA